MDQPTDLAAQDHFTQQLAPTPSVQQVMDGWAAMVIASPEEATYARKAAEWLKDRIARVTAVTDPVIKAAHAAWKTALAQRAGLMDPYDRTLVAVRNALATWDTAQVKAAQAAQRAAQEAAEAAALRERVQALGDPAFVPPPPAIVTVPETTSGTTMAIWSAEVVDFKELVSAVHRELVPYDWLLPNASVLAAAARRLKREDLAPGVRGVCTHRPVLGKGGPA